MRKDKVIIYILILLFITSLIFAGIIFHAQSKELKVVFLDVGQGDATLIEQGDKQILIDGGPSGKRVLEKLGEYVPFWDRKIDVIILTHPDADHVSGLVDVLKTYDVGEVIETNVRSKSEVDKAYEDLISEKNIPKEIAKLGMKINFSEDVKLEIFDPQSETQEEYPKDTNATSVVTKLIYGKNSFLFMGDLPIEKETELISENLDLDVDIIKVGHHGSKYSTSKEFLDKVTPKEAVISVGKENRYGHPNEETLERLKSANVDILRTDERGDITFDCQKPEIECLLNST